MAMPVQPVTFYITGHGRENEEKQILLPHNVTIKWYGNLEQTLSKRYNQQVLRGMEPRFESLGGARIQEHYLSVSISSEVTDRALAFFEGNPCKNGAKLITHTNIVSESLPLSGIIKLLIEKYPNTDHFILHWAACRSPANKPSTEQVDIDGAVKGIPLNDQSVTQLIVLNSVSNEHIQIGDKDNPTTVPLNPPPNEKMIPCGCGNPITSQVSSHDFKIPFLPDASPTSIRVLNTTLDNELRGVLMKLRCFNVGCTNKIDDCISKMGMNDEQKNTFKIVLLNKLKDPKNNVTSKKPSDIIDEALKNALIEFQSTLSVPQQQFQQSRQPEKEKKEKGEIVLVIPSFLGNNPLPPLPETTSTLQISGFVNSSHVVSPRWGSMKDRLKAALSKKATDPQISIAINLFDVLTKQLKSPLPEKTCKEFLEENIQQIERIAEKVEERIKSRTEEVTIDWLEDLPREEEGSGKTLN